MALHKAAAVALTVPALSAAHKLGDCLAAARTMRCHRLTLVRRSGAQHCGPSRPMRCRSCVRLGCWTKCAKGFVTGITAGAPSRHTRIAARRTRHPHSSGPARTRARGNDHDLHTRIEDGRRPSSRVCQPLATGATVEIPGPSCGRRALFKWPCWLPLSCRLPMSASGRERSQAFVRDRQVATQSGRS
jgi:hypothetical protein